MGGAQGQRLTADEARLVARLRTPGSVQRYLRAMPYNRERGGETLRGFRGVVQHGTAHCLEAALFSATVLERHGYPPTVMSFESKDGLDHVIHVVRRDKTRGPWGSIARSRDEGLHGRKIVFRSARDLAASYWDPYVDATGRITAFAVVDLRELGAYDWRLGTTNLWKVERFLLEYPHQPLPMNDTRYRRLFRLYKAWKQTNPDEPPGYHRDTQRWL